MTTSLSIVDNLGTIEKSFKAQNAYGMKFENECLFARQQLVKNDSALETAQRNQGSLKSAILNIAAIGISLNPALAHAYLVPRKGVICLDISYRGLVKLATDSGAIKWAKAELVYQGDDFKWRGPTKAPKHAADVYDPERIDANNPLKNLLGGYCIARLSDGDVLVDVMSAAEILKVKETSKAKFGPWVQWAGEMAKKTIIKRASKSWPQSNDREHNRVNEAISILNEHEGLEPEPVKKTDFLQPTPEETETYLALAKGDPVEFWLWYDSQDQRLQSSLPGCEFKYGEKVRLRKMWADTLQVGRDKFEAWAMDLGMLCTDGDEHGAAEFLAEFPDNQKEALIELLGSEQKMVAMKIEAQR